MLFIPLPFVVCLILRLLAAVLFLHGRQTQSTAFIFVIICAITVAIIGLRWTTDWRIFSMLQPIASACIPVAGWLCLTQSDSYTSKYQ
ncbi:MAG: hypothetical protein CENE_02252 [Candidatus Celerinatantimonas neptuna]|nr:MAG: hypothetical protein CENE_02252 [Candidatus Celerinatantimonas neptuna]